MADKLHVTKSIEDTKQEIKCNNKENKNETNHLNESSIPSTSSIHTSHGIAEVINKEITDKQPQKQEQQKRKKRGKRGQKKSINLNNKDVSKIDNKDKSRDSKEVIQPSCDSHTTLTTEMCVYNILGIIINAIQNPSKNNLTKLEYFKMLCCARETSSMTLHINFLSKLSSV